MPDGDYQLGRHTVTKCLGGVRLADGTLAGSTLTMDQALRNLVDARASTWTTHRGASPPTRPTTSALADRGRLRRRRMGRPRGARPRPATAALSIVEGEAIDLADA